MLHRLIVSYCLLSQTLRFVAHNSQFLRECVVDGIAVYPGALYMI